MKLIASLLYIVLMFLPHALTSDSQQKPEDLAQKSAEAWLVLTDSGKYGESWDEASSFFKSKLTKDQWQSALTSVRAPLGAVLSRKLKSAKYTKTLPGAPDGEYVILQYETSFDNLNSAVETITPMLDKDGKWRVSGYFIKPASM
jgi:hypothetical protein